MNDRYIMSATLPDVIDEYILSCFLCLREARQPQLLPCLHVFCQTCLQHYIKQQQEKQQRHDAPTTTHAAASQSTDTSSPRDQDGEEGEGHYDEFDGEAGSPSVVGRRESNSSRRSLERRKGQAISPEMGDFYRKRYRFYKSYTSDPDNNRNQTADNYTDDLMWFGDRSQGPALDKSTEVFDGKLHHDHQVTKLVRANSNSSLSSHVSSMVKIFESKTSESQMPPMAKFRSKSKASGSSSKIVPLQERPLPIYSHHVTRSVSHDQTTRSPVLVSMPRSVSINEQSHNSQPSSQRVSLTDHYYEIPEYLGHGKAPFFDGVIKNQDIMRPKNLDIRPDLPSRFRRTPSEHIYDEIPGLSHVADSSPQSPRKSLLRKHRRSTTSKDDSDLLRTQRCVRRNSSILDSYVTAGALSSLREGHGTNASIPLSTDDSNRLSELYQRMEGRPSERRSRMSQKYMTMDHQADAGLEGEDFDPEHTESLRTLIRGISSEFGGLRKSIRERNSSEEDGTKEERKTPPVYCNIPDTPSDIDTDEMDLDTMIPLYDTPRTPVSPYQIMQPHQSKEQQPDGTRFKWSQSGMQDAVGVYITCPTCDRAFIYPGQLSDCTFVSQLGDIVSSQRCERKLCNNCEVSAAQYRCLDCLVYLCRSCQNGHNWLMSNRGHRVMTLRQLQSGKYQTDMKHTQKTFCARDGTNEAKYVCSQCEQFRCADCVVSFCKTHQTRCIDEVAVREKDFVISRLQDLQHQEDILNGAAENLEIYQQHCTRSLDHILDELCNQHDYMKQLLDQAFDRLRSKAMDRFASEHRKVGDTKSEIQARLRSVSHVMKFTNQLLQHGNHANIVAMAPVVKSELQRLRSAGVPRIRSELQATYVPKKLEIHDVEKLCGRLKYLSRELEGSQHGSNTQELMKQNMETLEQVVEFNTIVASDQKGCRPNGLTVLPNNHLAIVDNINMKLKCFDVEGKLQWEISPKGQHAFVDPWDLTVLRNGNIAVTDKGSKDVKLFQQDGEFVVSFGGHLKEPWGICTNSAEEILVTDMKLRRIFVHDACGKLLNIVPAQGVPKQYRLSCPEYIACNKMDDIIISDFEKHCILVFDLLGRPLFTFGRKGTGFDEFYYPLGVSTDAEGNIFAINYKNQRITVARRNGEFLCCLSTQHPMQSMQAIATAWEGHLVVIDGNLMKVFKLPPRILMNSHDVDVEDIKQSERSNVLLLNDSNKCKPDIVIRKETTV